MIHRNLYISIKSAVNLITSRKIIIHNLKITIKFSFDFLIFNNIIAYLRTKKSYTFPFDNRYLFKLSNNSFNNPREFN